MLLIAGHIHFKIKTLPHKHFVRAANDLHYTIHISLLESLVGFSMRSFPFAVRTPSSYLHAFIDLIDWIGVNSQNSDSPWWSQSNTSAWSCHWTWYNSYRFFRRHCLSPMLCYAAMLRLWMIGFVMLVKGEGMPHYGNASKKVWYTTHFLLPLPFHAFIHIEIGWYACEVYCGFP